MDDAPSVPVAATAVVAATVFHSAASPQTVPLVCLWAISVYPEPGAQLVLASIATNPMTNSSACARVAVLPELGVVDVPKVSATTSKACTPFILMARAIRTVQVNPVIVIEVMTFVTTTSYTTRPVVPTAVGPLAVYVFPPALSLNDGLELPLSVNAIAITSPALTPYIGRVKLLLLPLDSACPTSIVWFFAPIVPVPTFVSLALDELNPSAVRPAAEYVASVPAAPRLAHEPPEDLYFIWCELPVRSIPIESPTANVCVDVEPICDPKTPAFTLNMRCEYAPVPVHLTRRTYPFFVLSSNP